MTELVKAQEFLAIHEKLLAKTDKHQLSNTHTADAMAFQPVAGDTSNTQAAMNRDTSVTEAARARGAEEIQAALAAELATVQTVIDQVEGCVRV